MKELKWRISNISKEDVVETPVAKIGTTSKSLLNSNDNIYH
jgi:hypothetical protein